MVVGIEMALNLNLKSSNTSSQMCASRMQNKGYKAICGHEYTETKNPNVNRQDTHILAPTSY